MNRRLSLFLAAASLVCAQTPSRAPRLKSPEVAADGRVTFRFFAPNAQTVSVNIAGEKAPFSMQKDTAGVWTFTSQPMQPDLYGYTFEVDGGRRLDPSNSAIIPNLLSPSSEVHVPGSTPLPWEDSDLPHGTVHHHFYRSSIVGDNRDLYVYTPPGYDAAASTLYPVLYLLHGYSDDASGWTAVGRANLILDSLIASKQAKPMLVVMPLGYGALEILDQSGTTPAFQRTGLREKNVSRFAAALTGEVVPLVERIYKVDKSREARAIAGLSMGGAESLLTGLNHLELFSRVASFSAGGLSADFPTDFPNLTATEANTRLHLLWVACGTDDRLIQTNRDLVAWLKSKQVNVTPIETAGMHTWMVWRRNLIAVAPLLFTKTPAEAGASTAGR